MNAKNLPVRHRILSEARSNSRLPADILEEIKILQDIYKDLDSLQLDSGYIQYFACNHFKAIMYTNRQILLYRTSSNKEFILLCLVLANPIKGKSAIPIAEMLSNDQHSSEIELFLRKVMKASHIHIHVLHTSSTKCPEISRS